MAKSKKNIFTTATKNLQNLRNSKIFKAIILTTMIISNSPLSAEETYTPTQIEDTQRPELDIIVQKEENSECAHTLKTLIDEIQLTNQYGEYLVSELATNNTQIIIANTNEKNYYLNNRIYIDVNYIKNATSAYKKQSLKETLGHEAVHMLQNKFKIFEKILSLPPKDGISLYLLMELDATMKSYIACDKYYNTNTEERANSTFNAITNVVNYAMNSYIKKAMLIYKNKTFTPNVPNTKDVIEEFNKMGIFPKLNLDDIENKIYNLIPEEYKTQIDTLEQNYIAQGKLLTQNTMAQK